MMAPAFFSDKLEPVQTSPDNLKERNLGYLGYYKPAAGLQLLREKILGEERFDKALREYIKRWAFKHPTPDDFFRTMENVTGEELNWFWRGWFLNNWKIDQAVKNIKYVNGDYKQGAVVTIENIGQLPMPVELEVMYKDGSKQEIKLPVEIWKRNNEWTFEVPGNKEISSVLIDPKGAVPDVDVTNNRMRPTSAAAEKVNLNEYTGTFAGKEIPVKVTLKVENNKLVAQVTGQQSFPVEYQGDGLFSFDAAGIELQFGKDKKTFTLNQGGQAFEFVKEK